MSHPPPSDLRHRQHRAMIISALVIIGAWQFVAMLIGGKFWLMPTAGIYIRNDKGTYDRFITWPLGRIEK